MPVRPRLKLSLSRRRFLQIGGIGLAAACSPTARLLAGDRYGGLASGDHLGEVEVVATVTTPKFFTEGPAADGKGHVYFTNVTPHHIARFDEADGSLHIFREKSNAANGLLIDPEGRLVACEGGEQEDGRVTRTDLKTGEISVLCDSFCGHALGAPNDLTLDAAGRIYFTSRLANTDPQQGNVNAVYRIDPTGEVARVLAAPDIDMPNGIVTSPDSKLLYLVESDGRENRSRCIRCYDLNADGALANGRILIDFYPGRSGDGMCIDVEGNLYIAAGLHKTRGSSETLDTRPGIHVVSPAGKLLAFAETPEDTITNCTFGGPDRKSLYVTCGKHLLRIRTHVAGHVSYLHP